MKTVADDSGGGRIIRDWVQWYNHGQPYSALGYRSPVQYRVQQSIQVD